MDRGNAFTCMKYTLILCNVFGFILAIFNALFGIGYPTEKWPGGYTGGQMAIFSLFVMAFTTIGYCGAQHHKGYLLIVYGKCGTSAHQSKSFCSVHFDSIGSLLPPK